MTNDSTGPDEPSRRSPLIGLLTWIGLAVLMVALLVAGAIWWINRDDGDDDDSVAQEGDVAAAQLEVGDCLEQPQAGKVTDVTAIPCARKHDSEVYATFDLSNAADAYPGEKKLFRVAGVGCAKRFEGYMGIPARKSRLGRSELIPDEAAWKQGDRGVTCLASMPGGKQTVGSLKGKKK